MATKYPIVLVHGIVMKDILFFRAFGRIEKVLKEEGNTVYVSKIDGFGTTKTNALALKEEILSLIEKEGCEKVNIIAHSKGGLDSKRMINEFQMEDKVASLTTLCTPHQGSPVASGILKLPKWMLLVVDFWLNFWYRIFGDKHPNALEVCRELALSEESAEELISDKVYCQSYSAVLEKSRDDFIMGIPLMFSRCWDDRESDGLVPSESSRFGSYRGRVEGSVSHTEIVDFMVKKKKRERIFAFYRELCKELEEKGM